MSSGWKNSYLCVCLELFRVSKSSSCNVWVDDHMIPHQLHHYEELLWGLGEEGGGISDVWSLLKDELLQVVPVGASLSCFNRNSFLCVKLCKMYKLHYTIHILYKLRINYIYIYIYMYISRAYMYHENKDQYLNTNVRFTFISVKFP